LPPRLPRAAPGRRCLRRTAAASSSWAELRPKYSFLSPFIRILEEGATDGTLRTLGDHQQVADLLFNTVCWPYVHLRGRHQWSATDASACIIALVLDGIVVKRQSAW
jgi:hypothetical protein